MGPTFVPARPGPKTFGSAVPPLLDLTSHHLTDDEDRAMVAAVSAHPGSVALWRSFRVTGQPERVYVVETRGPRPDVGAEFYAPGDAISAHTRAARNAGALLWTARPVPPIRIARVFDDGGIFSPDRPRLAGEEKERVAAWLEAGPAVLGTDGRLPDVVDPARGESVPMSYRTDGRWLWTESVAYYLTTYGIAPEPGLLAHIRSAHGHSPVDAVDEHRALAVLFQSHALVAQ
jgi:hypothetical protein